MRKLFFLIIFFISTSVSGQLPKVDSNSIKSFAESFATAIKQHDLSREQLDKILEDHFNVLMPRIDYSEFSTLPQKERSEIYPLFNFSKQKLYKDNIVKLLNSENPNQRILSYYVIGAAGDSTKENILLKNLSSEKNKSCLMWMAVTLFYLQTTHTTELFDFLIKYEDFGDAHMLPMYIKLNKDSLQNTAYLRINSSDTLTKLLAAQILSVTKLNSKTEFILKQAVKEWGINIKGYAIYSISQLQIGNLLKLLKPLLDSSIDSQKRIQRVVFRALANSPTTEDRMYLFQIADKQDTLSNAILASLYDSKNIESVRYWLKLLYTKPIPENYYFSIFDQPLIKSELLLPELQYALEQITNPEILAYLIGALKTRTDDRSVNILLSLLRNENKSVRYYAASILKNNSSFKLNNEEVQELIKKCIEDGK